MITHKELKLISERRFDDGVVLYNGSRDAGSIYLFGYAIELGLKAVLCKNLGLKGIPNTMGEFKLVRKMLKNITTHDPETLLGLCPSAVQGHVKGNLMNEWSTVQKWNPEMRYDPSRKRLRWEAKRMQNATRSILNYLWTTI